MLKQREAQSNREVVDIEEDPAGLHGRHCHDRPVRGLEVVADL